MQFIKNSKERGCNVLYVYLVITEVVLRDYLRDYVRDYVILCNKYDFLFSANHALSDHLLHGVEMWDIMVHLHTSCVKYDGKP